MLKIVFFPIKLVLSIASFFISLCGRLLTIILGIILVSVGLLFCVSLIGFFIGIPIAFLGFSMIIKGLF